MYDEREFDEHSLPAELAAFEKQLAAFAPMAPRVDRDRLMFAAGRASVGHSTDTTWVGSKFWPSAATLATAASLLLATMLVWQRAGFEQTALRQISEEIEIVPLAAEGDRGRWPDRIPSGYLGIRQVALTRGIGALDYELPAAGGDESEDLSPPATARLLLEELLPTSTHSSS